MSFKIHHSPFKILLILPALIAAFALLGIFPPSQQASATEDVQTNEDDKVANPTPKRCCDCFTFSAEIVSEANKPSGSNQFLDYINENEYECKICEDGSDYETENGKLTIHVSIKLSDTYDSEACKDAKPTAIITDKNGDQVGGILEGVGEYDVEVDPKTHPGEYEVTLYCNGGDCTTKRVYGCSPTDGESLNDGADGAGAPTPLSSSECSSCKSGGGLSPGISALGVGGMQMSIPAGVSAQGDVSASVMLESSDVTTNPGVSALRIRGLDGYSLTRDANGNLATLTTDSVHTEIVKITGATDPRAFEIKRSSVTSSGLSHFATTRVEMLNGKIVVSTTFLGATKYTAYHQVSGSKTITMSEGLASASDPNGLSRITREISTDTPEEQVVRMKVEKMGSAGFETTSDVEYTISNFSWGKRLTRKKMVNSAGNDLVTTWAYYQLGDTTGPSSNPLETKPMSPYNSSGTKSSSTRGSTVGVGFLKTMTRYDGYTEDHAYAQNLHIITTPYGATDTLTEVRSWAPTSKTLTITQRVNSDLISKTVFTRVMPPAYKPYRLMQPGDDPANFTITHYRTRRYTGGNDYLETNTYFKPIGTEFGGKIIKSVRPDGSYTTYGYSRSGTGAGALKTTVRTAIAYVDGGTTQGTMTTSIVNSLGLPTESTTTAVGSLSGTILSKREFDPQGDPLGRPRQTTHTVDSTIYTTNRTYGCCGISMETDRQGVSTHYAYDTLSRTIKTNRLGITTENRYQGLTTTNFRYPESGSVAEVGNPSGTPTDEISSTVRTLNGLGTTTYSPDADNDSNREITIRTTDYKVPPVAVPLNLIPGTPEHEAYIAKNTLASKTTITHPDGTTSISSTYLDGRTRASTDQLGNITSYSYDTYNGGAISRATAANGTQWTETHSDLAGRTVARVYPGVAIAEQTTYYPTGSGAATGRVHTTTDLDNITNTYQYSAKGDRTVITPIAGSQTRTTVTESDLVDNSVSGIGNARSSTTTVNGKLLSTSFRSLNGMTSKSVTPAGESSTFQSLPANGAWTVTSTTPDNQSTVQTYTDARLVRSESFDNTSASIAWTSYTYDSFGRILKTEDSRTGISYRDINDNATLDIGTEITASGAPLAVKDAAGNTTSFTYDKMGRRLTTVLPDSTVTHTSYTDLGQTEAIWGSQTYPRFYTYDKLQRMKTLSTWQDATNLDLSDGADTTELANASTTTWNYDTLRGWLIEKNYAGETGDGPGNTADYAYTPAGRLEKRTWERGVESDYSYDQGSLKSVTYSDATPQIHYEYDSFGRPSKVTQKVGFGSHDELGMPTIGIRPSAITTFTYDQNKFTLLTEAIERDTNADGTLDFTRTLNRTQDANLRPSTLEISGEYTNKVEYDAAGRLGKVWQNPNLDPNQTQGPLVPAAAIYNYLPGSYGLVESVESPAHTVTNTYEANRNVLTNKENKVTIPATPTVASNFAYTVNSIGQRESLATTGKGFDGTTFNNAAATGPAYNWSYNSRGELVEANDTSTANNDRAYQFDGIGNREKTANGLIGDLPTNANYTVNALNQYTSIPSAPSVLSHDADGNLTAGHLHTITTGGATATPYNATLIWDAENRLVEVKDGTTTIAAYQYDYLSRRISKTAGVTTRYIYDGWNIITEYTGTTLKKRYTWGMDLSGSMQGAGGVGGLLAVEEVSSLSTYYPTFDGNGNVSEYIDSSGAVQAHYEYDAFGNTIVSTGTKKDDFAHRFSTKPLDAETGLYYYGYRYYDPVTGRWPSRDPIGEDGGEHLYAFVANNALNSWDYLGWKKIKKKKCCCGGKEKTLVSSKCCKNGKPQKFTSGTIYISVGHSGGKKGKAPYPALDNKIKKCTADRLGLVTCHQVTTNPNVPKEMQYPNKNRNDEELDVGLAGDGVNGGRTKLRQEVEAAKKEAGKMCTSNPCYKDVIIQIRWHDKTGRRIIERTYDGSAIKNIPVDCDRSTCEKRGGYMK